MTTLEQVLPAWPAVDGVQLGLDEHGRTSDADEAIERAEALWQDGYTAGHAAGLAARPPADCYVPVPTRWRYARAEDTFVGGGALWHVQTLGPSTRVPGALAVTAVCGARTFAVDDLDLDEAVTVLVTVSESDAVQLAAEVLGARLISRGEVSG